ncbi:hypothetical protein K3495_g8609 [Podosphaera aphanis]|nr:hypothetical protein K3495_g8609 [Podosphaera aphanis]
MYNKNSLSNSQDTPLISVEDLEIKFSKDNPPNEISPQTDSSQPNRISSYTQRQGCSSQASENLSITANSESPAYTGPLVKVEYIEDSTDIRNSSINLSEYNIRTRSPAHIHSHRSIMEKSANNTQRSSSPLKRRASALEKEPVSSQNDDDSKSLGSYVQSKSDQIHSCPVTSEKQENSADLEQNFTSEEVDLVSVKSRQYEDERNAITTEIPNIDTQIKTILTIIQADEQKQLVEGDKVYLVSTNWLQKVRSHESKVVKASKQKPSVDIGPIDNSDITLQIISDANGTDFVQLKPGLGLADFTLFPETAWNLILEWYGIKPGTIPIIRIAHDTNPSGAPNIIFEFYPLVLKIHRLFGSNNPIIIPQKLKTARPEAPTVIFSRTTKWVEFIRAIKQLTEIDKSKKIRVWRVPRLPSVAESSPTTIDATTPPSSRPNSPTSVILPARLESQDPWKTLLLDVSDFLKLNKDVERVLLDAEDNSVNPKYNGSRDLSTVGLGEDQAIVLDEQISPGDWVSNHTSKSSKAASTAMTRTGASSNSQEFNARNNLANSTPMMTRGRAKKVGRTPGTVGLSNLGNTCYMNSALQCIRAVEELSKYFLGGAAMEELNPGNPLGNNGDVAVAYQKLLEEIYHKDIVPGSIAPRYFKNTIGKYAPSFSGYGQQDSQEFLGFLLDGLQEDLSRVKKKPYIEKPDSTDEMINNPDAIREMADKVWDITKQRDDSVIADLFTGMYKSTLVCPVCEKVSITFDPFNNLTLQLPIESTWSHNVFYFPLNDKPFTMTAEIEKQASIQVLKKFVSSRVGVPVERLFAAEEFKCKFFKFYKDYEMASDVIQSNDNLAIYELEASPTNWPPPNRLIKKSPSLYNTNETEEIPNWDDPLAESMVVAVIHRRPKAESTTRNMNKNHRKTWSVDCAPHFIVLKPDEARNGDAIKRKILEKIATFSTSTKFNGDDVNSNTEDSVDSDLVITSDSDINPGYGNVVAKSVASEEDVVDITMNDINQGGEPAKVKSVPALDQPQIPQKHKPAPFETNNRRPNFVDPTYFLKPELENMFEIGYCRSTNEITPSGWDIIKEDEKYPPISSRTPQIQATRRNRTIDDDSDDDENGSGTTGSDTSEGDSPRFSNATLGNEESESEDDPISNQLNQDIPVRTASFLEGQQKNYPKKSKHHYTKRGIIRRCRKKKSDNGPLVRLGEILVVDWNSQAYDDIFGGDGKDLRGQSTWHSMPSRQDEELVVKRKTLLQRKKNGITLDDCLNEFGKEEILSEMDTWYCPRCKEHRRASKKFELWMTPDILVMHLKRFSSSARRRDKLDIRVDFPVEGLDLSSRVVKHNENNEEIYDLFAVDNHWGGLGGGHYTACAKNFFDGEWYEYNDSSVTKQKNLSDLVSSSAYLLFYRRRSKLPLGGPRVQQIVQDYDNRHSRSEDETSERGEDQALVGNSSFLGSSSALVGVGAAHHPLDGLDSDKMSVNRSATDPLPAYTIHDNDDDAAGLMGPHMNTSMRDDIEDEGFAEGNDLSFDPLDSYTKNSLFSGGLSGNEWSFSGLPESRGELPSGTGSDDEISSERVQCNSCPSQTSLRDRFMDFEEASTKDDEEFFTNQSALPQIDGDNQDISIKIQSDLLERMDGRSNNCQQPQYVMGDVDILDVEDIATDIHLEDVGELNVD